MSTDFAAAALQSAQFATTRKKSARSLRAVLNRDQICERIKRARDDTGMSQEEFADVMGVHKRTIGNWESANPDEQIVPFNRMNDISEVTGRSVRWLLHGDDWLSAPEWAEIRDIKKKLDELLSDNPSDERRKAVSPDSETKRADASL